MKDMIRRQRKRAKSQPLLAGRMPCGSPGLWGSDYHTLDPPEEPGGLQSMVLQRVKDTTELLSTHTSESRPSEGGNWHSAV